MNRILSRANKRISLSSAAALLIGTTLIGQVLGFLRVKLINANFPDIGGQSTDAYFAAFKIPDFFFYTIAAGALGVAFIPLLSDRLAKNDKKGAWELSSSLMTLLTICMGIVGLVVIAFPEPLIRYVVAPEIAKNPEQLHNTATIMRFIAFNPLLFTLSGILTSMQQTFGRFFFYAIAPLFYNISIMVSAIIFSDAQPNNGGPGSMGIVGLGVGAMIGAILQFIVVLLGIKGLGFSFRPKINWKTSDFRLMLRQLPARSIDQGIDSINTIVETNFASRLGQGFLSYYENAYTLHMAPILLVGSTISTAAFPRLTERLSKGRPDLFRKDFLQILRTMIWIIAPIVVVCFFARAYFARMIFAKNANEIALIFGYLSLAIFFRVIYSIISRWFYAQKDTKTPLFVSVFAIGLNIILAYFLSRPTSYGVSGLAMVQSIVAGSEVLVLSAIMLYRDRKLFNLEFWNAMVHIVSVTGFSMIGALFMMSLLPLQATDKGFITLGSKLFVISIVTLSIHLAISALLGLEEVNPIFKKAKQFVSKPWNLT